MNVVDTDPPQKGRNPVPCYTEPREEKYPKEGREIPNREPVLLTIPIM